MKRVFLAVMAVLMLAGNAAAYRSLDCSGRMDVCSDIGDALKLVESGYTPDCTDATPDSNPIFAAGNKAYCQAKATGGSDAVARKAQKRAIGGYGWTAPELPPFFHKACTNWNVGKLAGIYAIKDKNAAVRNFQLAANAELDEKILSAKYGPFEGTITNAELGFGVRRGFTYKSLSGAFQRSVDVLSEDEMRVLIAIVGENRAKLPKSPTSKLDIPLQRGLSALAGTIGAGAGGFEWFATTELEYGGPERTKEYKLLWRALASNDPAAFADTVRAYQATKQYKAIKATMDDWCDPGRDQD